MKKRLIKTLSVFMAVVILSTSLMAPVAFGTAVPYSPGFSFTQMFNDGFSLENTNKFIADLLGVNQGVENVDTVLGMIGDLFSGKQAHQNNVDAFTGFAAAVASVDKWSKQTAYPFIKAGGVGVINLASDVWNTLQGAWNSFFTGSETVTEPTTVIYVEGTRTTTDNTEEKVVIPLYKPKTPNEERYDNARILYDKAIVGNNVIEAEYGWKDSAMTQSVYSLGVKVNGKKIYSTIGLRANDYARYELYLDQYKRMRVVILAKIHGQIRVVESAEILNAPNKQMTLNPGYVPTGDTVNIGIKKDGTMEFLGPDDSMINWDAVADLTALIAEIRTAAEELEDYGGYPSIVENARRIADRLVFYLEMTKDGTEVDKEKLSTAMVDAKYLIWSIEDIIAGIYTGAGVAEGLIEDTDEDIGVIPVPIPIPHNPPHVGEGEGTGEGVGEGEGEGTGEGTGTVDPPAVEAGAIDWGILMDIEVFDKFPFSLPWDVQAFFKVLSVPPQEPVFRVDIFGGLFGDAGVITLDFKRFDGVRRLVRSSILVLLVLGLVVSTKNFIWTGGG
jgi:hypothetical protein